MKLKRICAALLCLMMCTSGVSLAEPPSPTAQEMAVAIEAHLFGHLFTDMPTDELAALAVEQSAYDFIGRQNQDRTVRYLLGSLKPGAAKPNRNGYTESPAGLWNISDDGEFMLMQPGAVAEFSMTPVEVLFHKCTQFAGGLDSLKDASARGVSFVPPPPPFAAVTLYDGLDGYIEYIPLDEAQVRQFMLDKKIKNPKGYDYAISAALGEKDEYGDYKYRRNSVPTSLLQLAIDKCNYDPPFELTKALPVKAALTLNGADGQIVHTQVLEDAESLKELVKILRSMKPNYACKCSYNGALVLTYEDGTQRTFYKSMNSCGSIMMGSGASRLLSDKANNAFWKLFAELREIDDQKYQ